MRSKKEIQEKMLYLAAISAAIDQDNRNAARPIRMVSSALAWVLEGKLENADKEDRKLAASLNETVTEFIENIERAVNKDGDGQ